MSGERAVRCLVADASELRREGLTTVLRADGIDVAARAGDVHAALAMWDRLQLDVAIVDSALPGGTAEEREAFLAWRRGPGVVICLDTPDGGFVQAELERGARAFVLECSRRQDFVRAVRAAAVGESYIDGQLAHALYQHRARRPPALSQRERQVLQLLADGHRTRDVAQELSIAVTTVRSHVEQATSKLGASNRAHAAAQAVRLGIIC